MNVQVASQQPPTSAKVVLFTSHGQIDIQIWAKQTPLAARNFIQLCMQGYYNNTIFHRLIPGFMIQGGDPSDTGMGGESVFNAPFKDQFHQRLKFTKRGIVAMANAGKNMNGSQFFITFGACQHLNKKHTIFGKIVGDTIYNVMALQSLDTVDQDRPSDPPIIRKTKVVINPFNDIKARNQPQGGYDQGKQGIQQATKQQQLKRQKQQLAKLNKKQQLKKLKKKNKLTFDLQQDQMIQEQGRNINKIKSSHDVLYKKDKTLSNQVSITKQDIDKRRKQKQAEQRKAYYIKNSLSLRQRDNQIGQDQDNQNINKLISKQMNRKRAGFQKGQGQNLVKGQQQILDYQKRYNPSTKKYDIVFKDQLDKQRIQKEKQQEMQRKARQHEQIQDEELKRVRQLQLKQYNLMKADELNFKKAKQGSMKQRRKQMIHQEKKLLSNLQKHRYEYTIKQKVSNHEGQIFKKLIDFTSRLKFGTTSQEPTKNTSWMNHKLKFHIDSTNAYSLEQKKNQAGYGDQDDGGLKMEEFVNNQHDYMRNQEDDLYDQVNKSAK